MSRPSKWDESYIGKQYGYLTILSYDSVDRQGIRVICKCKCGKIIKPLFHLLRGSKQQKSCGCKTGCVYKHGYSKTKLYRTWKHIVRRCTNPKDDRYKDYGGRGIKVCEEWLDFLTFRFQMRKKFIEAKNKYKNELLSIERLNNDGNYNYENCIFIPLRLQYKNKRNTNLIKATNRITGKEVYGKTQTELAKKLNINDKTIYRNLTGKNKNRYWIIRPLLKPSNKRKEQ